MINKIPLCDIFSRIIFTCELLSYKSFHKYYFRLGKSSHIPQYTHCLNIHIYMYSKVKKRFLVKFDKVWR